MGEKPKGKPRLAAQENPCPSCGSDSYTWGKPLDDHPNSSLYFRPQGGGGGDGRKLIARCCNTCLNVRFLSSEVIFVSN